MLSRRSSTPPALRKPCRTPGGAATKPRAPRGRRPHRSRTRPRRRRVERVDEIVACGLRPLKSRSAARRSRTGSSPRISMVAFGRSTRSPPSGPRATMPSTRQYAREATEGPATLATSTGPCERAFRRGSGTLCTERAGFEPATQLSPRTRFPVALLRPLGHLSESDNLSVRLPASRARETSTAFAVAWSHGPRGHVDDASDRGRSAALGRGGAARSRLRERGQAAEVPGT